MRLAGFCAGCSERGKKLLGYLGEGQSVVFGTKCWDGSTTFPGYPCPPQPVAQNVPNTSSPAQPATPSQAPPVINAQTPRVQYDYYVPRVATEDIQPDNFQLMKMSTAGGGEQLKPLTDEVVQTATLETDTSKFPWWVLALAGGAVLLSQKSGKRKRKS